MARYELGAIYKIVSKERTYYARLLTNDIYGIFETIEDELCQEVFEQTGYRLYISTGSFAVKRGFWEKVFVSPDKSDNKRWVRPKHLVNFAPWDVENSFDRCTSFDVNGHTEILSKKDYVECVKKGFISNIFPNYENIATFLDIYYDNWPQSIIFDERIDGTVEHQEKQLKILKNLGLDIRLDDK